MGAIVTDMRRFEYILIMLTLILSLGLVSAAAVSAEDDSGLSLSLYGDPGHPNFKYSLSADPAVEPIKLIIVLKNISGKSINVERGLSQVELPQALEITDPCGNTQELSPETDVAAFGSKPSFRVGGRPTIPAEILLSSFAKSATIDDLRVLFPLMKKIPGLYKINAEVGGKRLVWTLYIQNKGLLGVSDHPNNWAGDIKAEEMSIDILPADGGHLNVQVVETKTGTSEPLFFVPVKVYKKSEIPAAFDLAETWVKVEPFLSGLTNEQGQADWGKCPGCLPKDDFVIIAKYANEFAESSVSINDSGWQPDCTGVIGRTILFGQPPPMVAGRFSVFGLNSVQIGKRAVVLSGDIGVNAAGVESKPKHKSSFVVKVDKGAQLGEAVGIYANSIRIEKDAVVYDVFYNELENKGQILGEMTTPLELPVWEPPAFVESVPGEEDIKVKGKKGKKGKKGSNVVELAAGAYDEVKIDSKKELHLLGGTYHFRSLKLDKAASLICLGPATILIEEGLDGHDEVYIGPDANSGISAADIVFYIGGIEEKKGKKKKPKPKYKKVVIGKKSTVAANIYAPNSTLKIEKESEVEGSFIARDVIVDEEATVEYNTAPFERSY